MFSDYLYDGSAFKPKQNHNPTDQARFVPFMQPYKNVTVLHLLKLGCCLQSLEMALGPPTNF